MELILFSHLLNDAEVTDFCPDTIRGHILQGAYRTDPDVDFVIVKKVLFSHGFDCFKITDGLPVIFSSFIFKETAFGDPDFYRTFIFCLLGAAAEHGGCRKDCEQCFFHPYTIPLFLEMIISRVLILE